MKILPNVLPPDPDIEKEKKEEYIFNKKQELIAPPVETNEIDYDSASNEITVPASNEVSAPTRASEPFMELVPNVADRELFTMSNEVDGEGATTDGLEIMIIERKDLEKTVTNQPPFDVHASDKEKELRGNKETTVFATGKIDRKLERQKFFNLSNGGILAGSVLEPFHDDFDEGNDSKSDYSSEEYHDIGVKLQKAGKYLAQQSKYPSSTLMHGFISNPGYPSFYIGNENECKWKLKLTDGNSIALTILDLHLRREWSSLKPKKSILEPSNNPKNSPFRSIPVDEFCKDSLEIVDAESHKSLYRGCSELSRPVHVTSQSNSVEVSSGISLLVTHSHENFFPFLLSPCFPLFPLFLPHQPNARVHRFC
jgi:CUB domain